MRKCIMLYITIILLLISLNIESVHATSVGNIWFETWSNYTAYDPNQGGPQNATITTVLRDVQGIGYEMRISLVVSAYQYTPYDIGDLVHFRMALYFESIAPWSGGAPPWIECVYFYIFKDGSDQESSTIHFAQDPTRPGYSQGFRLSKYLSTNSSEGDRIWWASKPLTLAISLIEYFAGLPPLSIALDLIDLATSFQHTGGDTWDASRFDCYACSFWMYNPQGSLLSPIRQYCFDTVDWKLDRVEPSTYYGLKVGALIIFSNGANCLFGTTGLYLGDIGLRIYNRVYGEGNGGCPTLFCWDGAKYVNEGILDIHSDADITAYHVIQNHLTSEHGLYKLKLCELDNFTSHIDYVRLFAVSKRGIWYSCPLVYAKQNNLEYVTVKLLFDDGKRVDLYPNQTIDLLFISLIPKEETLCIIFELNGYNAKTPWSG